MDGDFPADEVSLNHTNGHTQTSILGAGLNRLARNLWWTWNQEAQAVFEELSPHSWRYFQHNPVEVMLEVSAAELRVRLKDPIFAAKVKSVLEAFDVYMAEVQTWGRENAPSLAERPVAYFSAEFGFHESLPIAAGGLGILSADHAKSASDLGLGFVGLGLFYREGYFRQSINHENWQVETNTLLDPKRLPLEPVVDESGAPVIASMYLALGAIKFRAWRLNVGRIPIFLIDTDLPENEGPARDLTRHVYGGDSTNRVMQELLLGIGGVRLLRTMGIEPSVFHMNEGHAAFLTLELIREKLAAGMTFETAMAATREECVFTTHTPVEAGHDRFNPDLLEYAAAKFLRPFKKYRKEVIGLGRVNPDDDNEPFCMTVLALKTARAANGVSELHGRVSRSMWRCLWPDKDEDEVPIGSITNGVHLLSWSTPTTWDFWKRRGGADWPDRADSEEFWARAEDPSFVSDEEIWALRYVLRRKLIEFCRHRLYIQNGRFGPGGYLPSDVVLDPAALTIGFGRRAATYKRATLLFSDMSAIVELAKDANRPVQFIFSGKAHPRDDEGKRLIQKVIHLSKHSPLADSLIFVENYDVEVARAMVSGCDVWLNVPRRPLEASGTSGMKGAAHGTLNLSIMDGWWREVCDGANGFAIGDDSHPDDPDEQDRRDAAELLRVLSEEVVPAFYDRDAAGIPRRWIQMIRRSMAGLSPRYNTRRMVREYVEKVYLPPLH
ncbi:MAG: alpha-glucan family phosphorylase [Candidatus Aminicenantes bacterium]|nr:alpha-glucan family phosphorylase [Candidatus Aminicenantes bacterium]